MQNTMARRISAPTPTPTPIAIFFVELSPELVFALPLLPPAVAAGEVGESGVDVVNVWRFDVNVVLANELLLASADVASVEV